MTRHWRLAAALIALLSAPVASAEKEPVSIDMSGSWEFSSNSGISADCSFTGTAFLEKTDEDGRYEGKLTAEHYCPGYYHFVVEQSSEVTVFGNQVSVRSNIERYIKRETEPGWESYVPDNFALTVKSQSRLFGTLNQRNAAELSLIHI